MKYTNIKYKKINSKTIFQWLFLLVWSQHTLFFLIEAVVGRISLFSKISSYIFPIIVIVLIFMSSNYWSKIIQPIDLALFFIYILIILFSLIIMQKNSYYIGQNLWRMLGVAYPMFFLGIGYEHDDTKELLYWVSLLGVLVMFVYQIYLLSSGRVLDSDNMDASYKTLPSIIYLVYWGFEKKKIIYWIPVGVGVSLLFIFGTRGSILICASFILAGIFFYVVKSKSLLTKVFIYMSTFVCFCVLMYGDTYIKVAKFMSKKFGKLGFSTRIFDLIVSKELTEGTGRDVIAHKIWGAIKDSPIFGYGIMGDRVVLNAEQGDYAHNIVLEIMCDFGIIFGGFILAIMLFISIRGIAKAKNDQRMFVLGLSLLVFIKLSLSGSFLIEPYLFLLMGICTSCIRRFNNNRLIDLNINLGGKKDENCPN